MSFKNLLQKTQQTEVLDVGGGGLEGENTSNHLIERFGVENVTLINTKIDSVKLFMEKNPDANMLIGNYLTFNFLHKYDIVVLDLNIEQNLKDWENNHERAWNLLKPGGSIITYVMTTTDYGDPETKDLIRESMLKVWGTDLITKNTLLGNDYVEEVENDNRRNYIKWVILK